jgi:hypothetical protein
MSYYCKNASSYYVWSLSITAGLLFSFRFSFNFCFYWPSLVWKFLLRRWIRIWIAIDHVKWNFSNWLEIDWNWRNVLRTAFDFLLFTLRVFCIFYLTKICFECHTHALPCFLVIWELRWHINIRSIIKSWQASNLLLWGCSWRNWHRISFYFHSRVIINLSGSFAIHDWVCVF